MQGRGLLRISIAGVRWGLGNIASAFFPKIAISCRPIRKLLVDLRDLIGLFGPGRSDSLVFMRSCPSKYGRSNAKRMDARRSLATTPAERAAARLRSPAFLAEDDVSATGLAAIHKVAIC